MKSLNWLKGSVTPALPPRFLHWKTLLLFSVGIWLTSLFLQDESSFKDNLASLGWILLTLGICWRTTQPPFVIAGIPLSPWITGTLICAAIYQDNPYLAIKLWPLISSVLFIVIELFQVRFGFKTSTLFDRSQLILLLLIHLLFICWIEFYLVGSQWLEKNPAFLKNAPIIRQTDLPPVKLDNWVAVLGSRALQNITGL
ncbi:MAG: DUF5357 family protein [Microcoleaceae cyanobacterium]